MVSVAVTFVAKNPTDFSRGSMSKWVFGYTLIPEFDDMFYYGVFYKSVTYANFNEWEKEHKEGIEVTEILTAMCPTPSEREDFVKRIIIEIIKGEIEKPEWM